MKHQKKVLRLEARLKHYDELKKTNKIDPKANREPGSLKK